MRFFSTGVLIVFLLNVYHFPIHSNTVDLVKLKKEEEKRRNSIKKSVYSLSNQNLNSLQIPPIKYGFVEMTGFAESEEIEKEEKTPVEKKNPQLEIKYWQDLKKRLQDEIVALEQKVQKDQLQLNRLVTNYISMNLPLHKIDLKNQIDKLSGEINQDKMKLEELQNEMDSLPEQARKAGVPHGWVR